jgi:DNA-binding beta-propeller fold protein YncE
MRNESILVQMHFGARMLRYPGIKKAPGRMPLLKPLLLFMLTMTLAAGCSSEDAGGSSKSDDLSMAFIDDTGYPGVYSDDDDDALHFDEGLAGIGEVERTTLGVEPQTVDNFLYVLNPDLDTVSKIDFTLLGPDVKITTIPVGHHPSLIRACRSSSAACIAQSPVVLNRGDDTVSIIDVQTDITQTVEIRKSLNQIVLSPTGEYAVAFWDQILADEENDQLVLSGSGSNNGITLVDTDGAQSKSWAIGLDPSVVRFTPDGERAVILSVSLVSVLNLGTGLDDVIPFPIAIGDFSSNVLTPTDIEITNDGLYAYILTEETAGVFIVDLATGDVGELALDARPSDIDLAPDGDLALLTMRGTTDTTSRVLFIEPDADSPTILEEVSSDRIFGQSVIVGDMALLFTNSPSYRLEEITLLDIPDRRITDTLVLVKPVQHVFAAPDDETCLIGHRMVAGDSPISSDFYNNHETVTMMSLSPPYSFNPIALEGTPASFAFTDSGRHGLIMLPNVKSLVILDLQTRLDSSVLLETTPVYMGSLPGIENAFVSETHSLGRISFIDAETMEKDTITGFALNALIASEKTTHPQTLR